VLLVLGPGMRAATAGDRMTYTDFVTKVDAGQVAHRAGDGGRRHRPRGPGRRTDGTARRGV